MSEFSLIYTHFQHLTAPQQNTVVGIGDDGAISQIPPNHQLVSCIDTLVAGRHFLLNTKPYAIGYKSVAVNLSDLASMGATPYAILLGLSLPVQLAKDKSWIADFTHGIADICQPFGVELIGGDTTQSDLLTLSVSALGFVPTGQAITRDGAKVGDMVCVSGQVGSAHFALQSLRCGQPCELQSILELPLPQVTLAQRLRGFANSMIDISDGLGQDLQHILTASQVGAVLDLASIPAHPLLQHLPNAQKWQHQINGGDDYQLCFTMPTEKFKQFNQQYPKQIFAIGHIVAENGIQFLYDGKKVDFDIQGWQHF